MPFLSPQAAKDLAELVQFHDAVCRHELAGGILASERDYVSALATHLRFPFGSRTHNPIPAGAGVPLPFYCPPITSITLPGSGEQLLGCDGIIVLSVPPGQGQPEHLYKVGFFEAKWPRLFKHKSYRWDDKTHAGHSHFSHQLERQRALVAIKEVVVWEMFFSEEAVGITSAHSPHPWGSTCLMHSQTWNYVKANPSLAPSGAGSTAQHWRSADLRNLMAAGTTQTLAAMIENMANCSIGKPIEGTASGLTLRVPPDAARLLPDDVTAGTSLANRVINIPILNSDNNVAAIQEFMRQFGLRSYTHFPLDEDAINKAHAESRRAKLIALLNAIAT